MREVIETYILVIATVVAVSSVSLALIPTVRDLSNSYVSVSNNLNERIKTNFEIIFTSANDTHVNLWAKNTGDVNIKLDLVKMGDVFIVSNNQSYHFSLNSADVQVYIANGDADEYWEKGETLAISIAVSLPPDKYTLYLVLYNGAKDEDVFSR